MGRTTPEGLPGNFDQVRRTEKRLAFRAPFLRLERIALDQTDQAVMMLFSLFCMAKKSNRNESTQPTAVEAGFGKATRRSRPFWALASLVLGLFFLAALADYQPSRDPRMMQGETVEGSNLVGDIGVTFAHQSFYLLGGMAWLIPIILFWLMWIFYSRRHSMGFLRSGAFPVFLLSAAGLWAMQDRYGTFEAIFRDDLTLALISDTAAAEEDSPVLQGGGGILGYHVYHKLLQDRVGILGSSLLLGFLLLFSAGLILCADFRQSYERWQGRWQDWKTKQQERAAMRAEEKALIKAKREKDRAAALAEKEAKKNRSQPPEETRPERSLPPMRQPVPTRPTSPPPRRDRGPIPLENLNQTTPVAPPPQEAESSEPIKIVRSATLEKARAPVPRRQGEYAFPTLDLLSPPAEEEAGFREDHEDTARALIHTLSTFGVEAKIDEVHVGPVITRYDILPASGTKVSKIQNLENDIAMGLKALAVRILAPVPGKGCVGIEVPNRNPQAVCLRDILESKDWEHARAEIPIGLGKDVSGRPLVADLTKMPHLLIAGSTGSGKTVCINSIIASLLYHATPEDLRFIMVDPKIVEMKVFNDLPHMLIPVVTEPKKVPGALKWLLQEMEKRYRIFAKVNVRNIAGYRNFIKKRKEAEPPARDPSDSQMDFGDIPDAEAPEMAWTREDDVDLPEKLPYIVCIIDELADLMMVAPAEIETGIARLAQLARAAGIHLILATQRPSVNVITGVIKANLPSRISFKVASKVDSRTILDAMGADQLIGKGDMLFLPPGSSRLIRSQGAFVSDDEINAIVEYLKRNGPPQFEETVQRQIEQPDDGDSSGDEEEDELFEDALDVLRSTKRASTSMLQRRLKIGYNRAARIMELLEDRGIVGPENGSSPREILVDLESY